MIQRRGKNGFPKKKGCQGGGVESPCIQRAGGKKKERLGGKGPAFRPLGGSKGRRVNGDGSGRGEKRPLEKQTEGMLCLGQRFCPSPQCRTRGKKKKKKTATQRQDGNNLDAAHRGKQGEGGGATSPTPNRIEAKKLEKITIRKKGGVVQA